MTKRRKRFGKLLLLLPVWEAGCSLCSILLVSAALAAGAGAASAASGKPIFKDTFDNLDILGDDLLKNYLPADKWKADEDFGKYVSAANRKAHHQSRIHGYHVSYLRGESATCNLRKNPGLNLLQQVKLEEKLPKGKSAHVVLTRQGGHIRLEVNGTTFIDYTDAGESYSGGRFGFRQVYESDGYYDNVTICDLAAASK